MNGSALVRVGIVGFLVAGFLVSAASTAGPQERVDGWMGRTRSLPASEVVNGDYFAAGSLVTISGTVNGDVYAVGGQVLIDGPVNGDVLVAAGRVSISGRVSQDVRVAGGQMTLSGEVGQNLTVAGGSVKLARGALSRVASWRRVATCTSRRPWARPLGSRRVASSSRVGSAGISTR